MLKIKVLFPCNILLDHVVELQPVNKGVAKSRSIEVRNGVREAGPGLLCTVVKLSWQDKHNWGN